MISLAVLFPHWIAPVVLFVGGLAACSEEPTVVRVTLTADPSIAERAALLDVVIEGPDGEPDRRAIDPRVEGAFPYEVVVVPRGGDASRDFTLTVNLEDAGGGSLGVQRLTAGFERGRTRYAELRFSESCLGVVCGPAERCDEGSCRPACGEPAPAPGSASDCAPDGGVPDSGPPDLGTPDAGPASCSLDDAVVVERFPDDDLGRPCPDFEAEPQRCSAANHSSLAVVETSVDDPAPFCGPSHALHVIHPDDTRAANAYFALPASDLGGMRVMRTMIRIPTESHDTMVAANRPLSSFVALLAGRRVAAPTASVGVTWLNEGVLRVDGYGPDGARLSSTTAARFPVDDWFCLELAMDLEADTVQLRIDGIEFAPIELEAIGAAFAAESVTYARVGPMAPAASIPLTLEFDDLALGSGPLPCPP
tara:strand:+ start:360 stop:1625 length:1266 start_codon:yes stop_codon:yes gene_type:complete